LRDCPNRCRSRVQPLSQGRGSLMLSWPRSIFLSR
jgi:hypothetical protein